CWVVVKFVSTAPEPGDQSPFSPGYHLTITPPRGGVLDAREYPSAAYPARDGDVTTAGIQFLGAGRGTNTVTGKFVVWEVEVENGTVRKLAVDFIIYPSGKTDTPLVGTV